MSTSTVDNTNIVGTKTGPELVTELNTQIGNAKTDLEARPTEAGNETISGNWNITGIPIDAMPVGGGLSWRHKLGDIEAAHTSEHEIEYTSNAAGTLFSMVPKIDGTSTPGKEFHFNFALERWKFVADLEIGGDIINGSNTLDLGAFTWAGNTIWHAGNFTPANKSDTSHSHDVDELNDVNIAGRSSGDIMEWNGSQYIHVVKPTGSGSTNISISRTATTVTVNSDTGLDGIINEADGANAGIMTVAQHDALDTVISDLDAEEAVSVKDGDFGSDGLCTRTSSGNYANRTIVAGSDKITVAIGNGKTGNPSIDASTEVRRIFISASEPGGWADGDLWFKP
jgi:hypothetical protein